MVKPLSRLAGPRHLLFTTSDQPLFNSNLLLCNLPYDPLLRRLLSLADSPLMVLDTLPFPLYLFILDPQLVCFDSLVRLQFPLGVKLIESEPLGLLFLLLTLKLLHLQCAKGFILILEPEPLGLRGFAVVAEI